MVLTLQCRRKVFEKRTLPRDNGGNQALTGESTKETVKPSRRESRSASAEPVCSCAHLLYLCTRDRGCSVHPAFPAPSVQMEGKRNAKLGQIMSRERGSMTHAAATDRAPLELAFRLVLLVGNPDVALLDLFDQRLRAEFPETRRQFEG